MSCTYVARHVPKFQSTLSVRRATFQMAYPLSYDIFQSTLSVRRATGPPVLSVAVSLISIHALREESDRRRRW